MPQNLKLIKPVFVRADGYFYHLTETNDTLFQKVDSGENAFSYPLDTNVVNEIECIQHDGRFFYTLENITAGNGQLYIKKWKIEDYILKLQRTYSLVGTSTRKFDCNTFSIEHFHRELDATAISGANILTLDSNDRVDIGDILQLGPSTFTGDTGKTEEVSVLSVLTGNQVQLNTTLQNSYNTGDLVDFSKRCWFFNRFRPNDTDTVSGTGQLYSFDLNPLVTNIVARKAGNEFKEVLASTFLTDSPVGNGGTGRDYLVYMNQTNLLFIETDPDNESFLDTVLSAAQNNQETTAAIIPVYAITHEDETLFRLQKKATYRTSTTTTTEDWSSNDGPYNYQTSTLKRLSQSISLTVSPAVISADGVSEASIRAIVKDQFDQARGGRTVSFTENDGTGSPQGVIVPGYVDVVTASGTGIANSKYRAGSVANTVTITATTS